MSAMLQASNDEGDSGATNNLMVPTSPRQGQKRLRNGDPITFNGTSGTQTPNNGDITPGLRKSQFAQDASIVLVGIRGSGKRSLGLIAATALGRRFITEDYCFQASTGLSRQEYLRIHGSEDFHKQDVEVSRQMLEENRTGCVIDCGLGSLTKALQEQLRHYCQSNPVVYIQRDMASIKSLLRLSEKSAQMLESGDSSHRRCSNFEFYNIEDVSRADIESSEDDRASPTYSFKLQKAQVDFSRFVRSICGLKATSGRGDISAFSSIAAIETKLFTHSLVLPVSYYRVNGMNLVSLEAAGDVVEVYIDEWQDGTIKVLSKLVGEVRRQLDVPIMISIKDIGEQFPITSYFSALRYSLRLVPEFLVVDLTMESHWIAEIASHNSHTRLVGRVGHANAQKLLQDSDRTIALLEKALSLAINLVRITAQATSRNDEERFEQFVRALKHRYASRLWFSAYLTGFFGRRSQIFNHILSPVTHATIGPRRDHTPDMTAYDALTGLFASCTLDPLQFHVLGANVSNSLSPAMHNAAYRALGLRHIYTPFNVSTWEDIQARAQSSDFGGSSIAQPWKVKILEHLTHLSEHARGIGAINTLVPLRGDRERPPNAEDQAQYRNRAGPVLGFYGDNSDWISIRVTLDRHLSPRNVIHAKSSALIVGAGGMARAATYALLQAGCRNIFVHNRTVSNAHILVKHFSALCATQNYAVPAQIKVLESSNDPWPAGFAQPTIIVSCVTHERLPGEEHVANFTVPEQWLGSETGGAAVEQAYYVKTPFIQQIQQLSATTGRPWVVADGLEVLHAQAIAQFEIMTGKKAPKCVMWAALEVGVRNRDGKI